MSCFPARGAPSRCSFRRGTPSRSCFLRGTPSRCRFLRGTPSRCRASLLFGFCLILLACRSRPVVAAPDDVAAEEAGIEIAREVRARKLGFGNFTARQVMLLRNKRGQESQRQLRVRVLEVEGDGDRSMFVFDQPRDVEGTAFLIYSHKEDADEQWLYLPALKRVKRISSSNRSGSFMGSEFAYEDMSAQEVEKFTYRYLRAEPCGETPALTCTVSERFPADPKSGYSPSVGLARQGRTPPVESGVLRPQGRAPEDAHTGELRVVPGQILVRQRDDDGQPPHGQEYGPDVGRLPGSRPTSTPATSPKPG